MWFGVLMNITKENILVIDEATNLPFKLAFNYLTYRIDEDKKLKNQQF